MCVGLIAWIYIESEEGAARLFSRLRVPPPIRTSTGGVVLVLLALTLSGHRSLINATQQLGSPKSRAFQVDAGHACQESRHVRIYPRIALWFPWIR